MRKERIESKQQQLRELILQQVSFKSLVMRNQENEERGLVPSQNSAIQLPFITVNAHKKTQINCMISDDKWVLIHYSTSVNGNAVRNLFVSSLCFDAWKLYYWGRMETI